MKVDMNKIPGYIPVQETGPGKRKKPVSKYKTRLLQTACLAMVLSVVGGATLFTSFRSGGDVSADEPYDIGETVPVFTVQQYADVKVPDIGGEEGVPVIIDGKLSRLTVDNDGRAAMKTERMQLYEDYETDWEKVNTIGMMSCLDLSDDGPEGFRLSEVWFGSDSTSENQSDFLVLQVPERLDSVTLTNNPEGTGISVAEGGYYKPDAEGNYKISVTDGMTVRLIYEEKESWTYADVSLYDYDVTDGGYYLEPDHSDPGEKQDTSARTGDEETIYLDAAASGIHSDENYRGSGARFAFGADGIGTDMSAASLDVTGTLNVFNQKNKDLCGITPGLVKGLSSDGIRFVENVNAPALFDGTAAGRTDYCEREYSLGFDISGYTHTLSSVESAWGTCIEDMGLVNDGFWILDNAPSYNTDGHDVAYTGTDDSVQAFRTGDKSPVPFAASDDGAAHNRFFGLSYTADFMLSPGYTGPLDVFTYGDDDVWVLAAQVDGNGNVKQDTVVMISDLGGVHDSVGSYVSLWDKIGKVPYGAEAQTWRLFFFWLERDGVKADTGLLVTLPELGERKERDTASLLVEASNYDSTGAGITRTFLLDDSSDNRYHAIADDGSEMTIASGTEFTINGGDYVSIGGLTPGSEIIVSETGRDNVWHSYGDKGFDKGKEAPCIAGITRKAKFISTVNSGTLSIGVDAAGDPEGGFRFLLTVDGMPDSEISAMDAGNNPLGSRMMNDGKLDLTLSAGEVITLYNLPDGSRFTLEPLTVPDYDVSEILVDHAGADGAVTSGELPASVIYRFEQEEDSAGETVPEV